MKNKFSVSVNIKRDSESDINYIPTPNAVRVVNQIVNDYKVGMRSFSIVGSYGTGKSSFLLAFEQSLTGSKRYFNPGIEKTLSCEFVNIIGSYNSIIEEFARIFNVESTVNIQENILSEIFYKYYSSKKKDIILFLVIDEFGKFLEYASNNKPEEELYFIQQLAEFCNNPEHNIVLLTTIHQNIDAYAYQLNKAQQNEWTKVKGRFREITFNEPADQLLFLAAENISSENEHHENSSEIVKSVEIASYSKAFSFNSELLHDTANNLFPLEILSGYVLVLSLQRYGQNERSLFTFLESIDQYGIHQFRKSDATFYDLSKVYDYLMYNFYSYLVSRYNTDFSAWSSIRSAIEQCERLFDVNIEEYIKIVKSIGLLNIFAATGSTLDTDFYTKYFKTVVGISNPLDLLKSLEEKHIIRFRQHSRRYILFEGTDLDIQGALIEAGNRISEVNDVPYLLNKTISFQSVSAKEYTFETGTPRNFEFVVSDHPISLIPNGEIDGYINIIINPGIDEEEIQRISLIQEEAILYCYFKRSTEIKNLLYENEKVYKVLEENKEDRVAIRELEIILESQKRLIKHYLIDNLYQKSKDVVWYFAGKQLIIEHRRAFNKILSHICSTVYSSTPCFKNELVNKQKISSSIHTAKKNYFKALAHNWDKENLGFSDDRFPPEKTIYLSLLKENSISVQSSEYTNENTISSDSSFYAVWVESERFLQSAKTEKVKISRLNEALSKRPFKLKQGLIDFWVPTFLFLKRDDFALFNEDGYIPYLTEENLELLAKYPDKYFIKTFDIEGVKLDVFNNYRTFLNISTSTKYNNQTFIETIKPFLIFYKQLPNYTKNTNRLSTYAKNIRLAIATSKDPEETFFKSFPNALGYSLPALQNDTSLLQQYTILLQDSIKELRTAYDGLLDRFEKFICNEYIGNSISFDECKASFQKRYATVKKHMLLQHQKTFVQRIESQLDDRKSWLNSIAQATTGKTLDNFTDQDEVILYDKFKSFILELDGLTQLSATQIDETQEEVYGVTIDSFFDKIDPKIVRIPNHKKKAVDRIKENMKNELSKDNVTNIAAILKLLKELL